MRSLLLIPVLALAACLPHPPPAPPPAEVMAQSTDVPLARLAPQAVAAYLGVYRGPEGSITIRRSGDDLFADRNGATVTAPLKIIGLGTFVDAAGTAYMFLPADGSSGRLRTVAADGSTRDWSR